MSEQTGSKKVIPMKQFGKDHWSTFAYVVTRCINHRGTIGKQHMRCDSDRHPQHFRTYIGKEVKYPTLLHGFFEDNTKKVNDHDDWDCLDDLVVAGLLFEPKDKGTGLNPVYDVTEIGWIVSNQLDKHKAGGKYFASFVPFNNWGLASSSPTLLSGRPGRNKR